MIDAFSRMMRKVTINLFISEEAHAAKCRTETNFHWMPFANLVFAITPSVQQSHKKFCISIRWRFIHWTSVRKLCDKRDIYYFLGVDAYGKVCVRMMCIWTPWESTIYTKHTRIANARELNWNFQLQTGNRMMYQKYTVVRPTANNPTCL